MSDPIIHFEDLVDREKWTVTSRAEWKRTSQCIRYFRSKMIKYQTEIESFGMVTRSKNRQYEKLQSKLNFNKSRYEKNERLRRAQINEIEEVIEELEEYGVAVPSVKLDLNNDKDLGMLGEIVDQANKLKMSGHNLAVYEGRGELMECLEDREGNLITRQNFRRG